MSPPSRPVAALALAVAIAALTGACQQSGSPGSPDAFKVALLTPGPISDGGWNASAYDGLMLIKKQLAAEVSNVQTANPAEFEQGFRDYARQGYDLVIGHGFEYQDAALKVGAEYPETDFVVSSGSVFAKNVASLTFHLDEATYLAGIVAASMSKTGKAGCVGGIKLPVILSTFDGFVAGAKSVKPDFSVATVYIGSFEDVAAAKAATDALVAQGADFVLHNADAAALGVFQSAKEHGIYAFGTNRDQNDIAPETVLASATIDIPRSFLQLAREAKDHAFVGRVVAQGLASGCVGFVWNQRLKDRVPPEVQARVEQADAGIRSGAVKVRP
ncbi:MAG TPA: BMP family protein [Candidatus Binatia bacterium]|nr:BMP family protein [Candidatus Binatia bacterium]